MFLIADPLDQNEPALFQARQFAFDSAGARMDVSDDLRRVEATFGMAENERQYPLLHVGKQRTRQACIFRHVDPILGSIDPKLGIIN